MRLDDKIVVISGGGRGIGRATALRLAAAGALVIICARTGAELADVQERIRGFAGRCELAIVDVTRMDEVREFVAGVRRLHDRIDILINNAGFCPRPRPVEEVPEEEYKRTLATNLDSVFYFTRLVVPMMRAQNAGTIITVSSGCGRRGYPGLSAYSASKFALQGFMESLAAELESSPIRSVTINPGAVATRMRADIFGPDEAGRHQSPEAIAEVIYGILAGKVGVPNGGGVCIRQGTVSEVYGPGQ